MRISKRTFLALVAFGLPALVQAGSTMNIQVDKGSVSIEIVPELSKPEVKVVKSAECASESEVHESAGMVKVTHPDNCQRGHHISIRVGSSTAVDVALKAGNMTLKNSAKAFKAFSEVKSVVLAGSIFSTVPGLVPVRTENQAGATAVYKNLKDSSKESLSLMVQAGMIHL
ncbi:MAG: hypothetical protein ACK5QT_02415 [Oligoflexia bacterium]|jgi:hypothetical protein